MSSLLQKLPIVNADKSRINEYIMKLGKRLGLVAFAITLFAAATQTGAEAHGFGGHGVGGRAWGGHAAAAHFAGRFGGVQHFAVAHYGYGFRHVNAAYSYANYVPNTVYVDAPNNVSADNAYGVDAQNNAIADDAYGVDAQNNVIADDAYGVAPNGDQIIEPRSASLPAVTCSRRQTVSTAYPGTASEQAMTSSAQFVGQSDR